MELPSVGPKEKETESAGGAEGGATKKVKKICHKAVKATVLSPEASHLGQSVATTTASQQASTVQKSTDEVASQKVTAPSKLKVYQKQAAKKQKRATADILEATKQITQATTVSMQAAAPPKPHMESPAESAVVIGQEKDLGKGSAGTQSKNKGLAEQTGEGSIH